ncbi:hypothetical protein PHYPSEUDO_008672 [Phytophthora pseudosyringae]|uniref:Pectinesterase n=1 Tax=Phytophthora pseudosyringae TaxID=221518 RepID=A0A8T1VGN9_9STRA|nr:hypothetical protein PHYPSEUDO_008672 [Phytophthora pseudosyringae]
MKIFTLPLVALAGLVGGAAATGLECSSPDAWTGAPTDAISVNSTSTCTGEQTRTQPPPGAIIVDATGAYNGSYKTVVEGVAHVPNTTDEHTLFMFPGVYHEQVVVPKLNGPLVLQGYTCDTMSYAANEVTITQAKAQKDIASEIEDNRNFLTATIGFRSKSGVKVYNLNVANTDGKIKKDGQAVAVYVDNTDYGFYGCNFTSYQDTLCAHRGRELYARSYISGAVDFIFGQKSMAWFESCELESVGKGWVTANGNKNGTIASEYVFNNARVFSSNDSMNETAHLGRPWGEYARTVFQNSELGDVVNLEGWAPWDNETSTDNVYFKEFSNKGPGAVTDQRVAFSGQLDAAVEITEILGDDYASQWWVDASFL